jgi:hypothetical protein
MANFLVDVLINFSAIFVGIGIIMGAAMLYHYLPDDYVRKLPCCHKKRKHMSIGRLDTERYPMGSSLYPELC